jgi:hypothetical protein
LHDETLYSKPKKADNTVRTRKIIEDLKKMDHVNMIADEGVRRRVVARLEELGGDFRKLKNNHPYFLAKDGSRIPIHRVAVRAKVRPVQIGSGARARFVKLNANHHAVVFERQVNGQSSWDYKVVTRLEAVRRLATIARRKDGNPAEDVRVSDGVQPTKANMDVIDRTCPGDTHFLFSLAQGDTIEVERENTKDGHELLVVTGISDREIECRLLNDARQSKELRKKDIPEAEKRIRLSRKELQDRHCRKVTLTPLGEVRRAGG